MNRNGWNIYLLKRSDISNEPFIYNCMKYILLILLLYHIENGL